eukprot:221117_1
MESDTSSEQRFGYHTCITVYPLLITRIAEQCDLKRLLNEYIFKGDNAHHEKYMIISSGSIENGQFTIYFTNNVSAESIYETMKSELFFSCTIPRKQFITQPNKDRFIPQTMRKWRWKKEINLNHDWAQYSFKNCYQIEHALENKHDTVILALKDQDEGKDQENQDINTQNKKRKSKSKKKKKKNKKNKAKDDDHDIASWHLIIFNEEYSQDNKNVANICKTDQIEIESETCHQGLVTKMDWDNKTGYVRNREWNVIHSFEINPNCDKLRANQLISFTLCVPKSFYVSSEPITATDCVATNIDIMSGAMLSRRTPIKYPAKLNADLAGQFQKLSLFTPSNSSQTTSSTEGSPIMFISPKQRAIHTFKVNQPQRRHSVTSTHHHGRSNSRFLVKHAGRISLCDTDDIHELLIRNYGGTSKSTPYRIHMHHLQSKTADLRNVSREVSLTLSSNHNKLKLPANSPSPSGSLRSLAVPLSPLSEIGSDNYVAPNQAGNITPSSSVDRQIENSESREKSERYCLLDMASWTDKEFKEFLKLIGEQDFIKTFVKNAVKPNHLKVADESMLRSLGLPLIHIKNILMERDYYKNADQQLQSLAYVNVKKENEYALELKLKEIKTIMNNSRVARLKLQRLKCRKFALRHHEVVQMIKEFVEIFEDAMEDGLKPINNRKPNKAAEGEFKETKLSESDEETTESESEEEKEWSDNKILVFRAERELVSGCNRFAESCVGCISLQLMNMNYIRYNFGESSVGLVRLQIEEQLIDKINKLLARYESLRVHIYKSPDVLYYTLIVCDQSDDDCLGWKGFKSFLQNDLTEIGFRVPRFWKRDSDKALLWKRKSVHDIYSDIDKIGTRERKTSASDSDQLEGMSKRGGGLMDIETSEIEYSMSRCSMSRATLSMSDTKSPSRPRKSFSSLNIDKSVQHVPLASPSKEMSRVNVKDKTPRKPKSKFRSLKKGLKKRLSLSSKKKNKSKKKASFSSKKELGDVDEHHELKQLEELRGYGFDNESLNLSEHNHVYFMMGSVHIGMVKANLYQEIQKVRKTIHKNLENRCAMYQNRQQSNGDMISASSVNDLFFVKRL